MAALMSQLTPLRACVGGACALAGAPRVGALARTCRRCHPNHKICFFALSAAMGTVTGPRSFRRLGTLTPPAPPSWYGQAVDSADLAWVGRLDEHELAAMSKPRLKDLCKGGGFKVSGTKGDLIGRLMEEGEP